MSEERQYCNDCGVETDGEFCENCDQYQKASISQIAGRSTQRLPTWGEWVSQQRGLAKKLGLNDIEEYLGKVCEVCGKPAKKGAKRARRAVDEDEDMALDDWSATQ